MNTTKPKNKDGLLVDVIQETSEGLDSTAQANETINATTLNPNSKSALQDLQEFLESNGELNAINGQPFAAVPLTKEDSHHAQEIIWKHHVQQLCHERGTKIAHQKVAIMRANGKPITMKYCSKLYHPKSKSTTNKLNARIPLYIGLHGGGGCPAAVNDAQWVNHTRIYNKAYQSIANSTQTPLLYIVPRAPTNNWNLWHEPHMDGLFDRLIETLVASQNVDSNKVFLSGYSAGGDGVYQLAPRMADRWAAVSMMAGHPNGVSLRGIYNLPFSLHVGGKDAAYERNDVGRAYKKSLEEWKQQEQGGNGGYQQIWAKIYEERGHGLGGEDAAAMEWMSKRTRNPCPTTLVWDKDSARHCCFYWVRRSNKCGEGEIRVTREGQSIVVDLSNCPQPEKLDPITFCLNDAIIDFEKPVAIYRQDNNGQELLQETRVSRTIGSMWQSERRDPNTISSAQIEVDLQCNKINNQLPKHLRGS